MVIEDLASYDAHIAQCKGLATKGTVRCALPGCAASWEATGTAGRPRIYCTAAHREIMKRRRVTLERREARHRPRWPLDI